MIIYTTKNRFFVATDLHDYVQWLQRNYVDLEKEKRGKRKRGDAVRCDRVAGEHVTKTKRYNYNLTSRYKR